MTVTLMPLFFVGDNHKEGYTNDGETNFLMSISPGNTTYFTPVCNEEFKPYVGQRFRTIADAITFYEIYASNCGFEVRGSTNKKANDGSNVTIWKYFVCNREGFKNANPKVPNDPCVESSSNKKQRKTLSNRCGCIAKLAIRYGGSDGYVLKIFEERHTHPMMDDAAKHFAKSNRKVSAHQKEFIMNCLRSNIGLTSSYKVYKEMVGSYSKIGATLVDFKNFKRDLNSYLLGCDAQMVIDDFFKKKEICEAFHFDYDVDEEQKLCRLFWCDPIARKSFSYFGDVVSADATYKMNRYVFQSSAIMFSICTIIMHTVILRCGHSRTYKVGTVILNSGHSHSKQKQHTIILNSGLNHTYKVGTVVLTKCTQSYLNSGHSHSKQKQKMCFYIVVNVLTNF
jgi:hypothetical protein